jgi:uncharacterized membrane protein YuzA (DUF378 family)
MSTDVKSVLGKVTWILTALGSINWGLVPFGYSLFSLPFVQENLGQLQDPFYFLIGAAGLYSLITFFTCSDSCS